MPDPAAVQTALADLFGSMVAEYRRSEPLPPLGPSPAEAEAASALAAALTGVARARKPAQRAEIAREDAGA